jgi:hypothetical protein
MKLVHLDLLIDEPIAANHGGKAAHIAHRHRRTPGLELDDIARLEHAGLSRVKVDRSQCPA